MTLTRPTILNYLGGIANGLPIQGIGTVTITLHTHESQAIILHIPNSLYVPNLPCNLISPQWLIQTLQKQNKNSSFCVFPYGCLFIIDHHVVPFTIPPHLQPACFPNPILNDGSTYSSYLFSQHIGFLQVPDPTTWLCSHSSRLSGPYTLLHYCQ